MPSFLSSLRRRSRLHLDREDKHDPSYKVANGHANGLTNGQTNGQKGNAMSRSKSSSTLNSSALGSSSTSTTPATSTSGEVNGHQNGSKEEIPPIPTTRPQRPAPNPTKRYSLNVRVLINQGRRPLTLARVCRPQATHSYPRTPPRCSHHVCFPFPTVHGCVTHTGTRNSSHIY